MSIELILSEFGPSRLNAGGADLSALSRLNPTLDSFKKIFPDAKVTLYTDQVIKLDPSIKVVKVNPHFKKSGPRYGWRANDYYCIYGLLNSNEEYAISMDADMLIVSPKFSAIAELAKVFGLALPLNPRLMLLVDGTIGADSTYRIQDDITLGTSLAYNMSPIAFSTRHSKARLVLEEYLLRITNNPGRGPVHMAESILGVGYQPCVLPPQWCVCTPKDLNSKHIWNEAICLHIGHSDVYRIWRLKKFIKALKQKIIERIKWQ
ncbi:hypothetical protein [Prochlorococcus sp. MIT 1341]|uniref:hypothetical protein n=1 Tax=Prochlorococcus sp. MIT 1341 TaxID=3096221 RepID=UPI002A760D25|nr:hypothetical protein [Prochlorococcus sp. MIT 1341]